MAEQKWSHFYSDRRHELMVLDGEGNQIFSINGEEIFEEGIDQMTDEQRREWLWGTYHIEIMDILESRA